MTAVRYDSWNPSNIFGSRILTLKVNHRTGIQVRSLRHGDMVVLFFWHFQCASRHTQVEKTKAPHMWQEHGLREKKIFHGGSVLKLADDNKYIKNPEAQNREVRGYIFGLGAF